MPDACSAALLTLPRAVATLATMMTNLIQRVAGLFATALVAISLAVSLTAFSAPAAGEGESPEDSSADSDGGLVVTLESTFDQLPGGVVEFIATVENKTGRPQTNLTATMIVPEYEEALQYVEDSTIGCCAEGGAEVALPPLGRHPTLLSPTLTDHRIWFRWDMTVSECALRDRWVEVVVTVRTDEIEDISALTRFYIVPHTDLLIKRFSAAYDLDTPTPAPGDPVHHTVRIVNDGRVVLDDLMIHLNPHSTLDEFLPTVSENASFYIVGQRGEEPGRSVAVDPKWSKPTGRFTLDYLNPGNIIVLSWTDYVATDAPIGTVVMPHVSVRAAGSQEWTTLATRFTVSLPRDDLEVDVQAIDPGYLVPSYSPGDLITMRVAVSNRTTVAHDDLHLRVDLPFALSYVEGSASYSTPIYVGANARRVTDTWIDTGLSLPSLEPGHWSAITFKAKVGDSVAPANSIETYATLRTADGRERHDTISVDVVPKPDIEMTVQDLEPTLAGTEARVNVDIRNIGDVSLTDVRFGWEAVCTGISYVPGSLIVSAWVPTETGSVQKKLIRDDGFVLEQQQNNEDVSVPIGDLTLGDDQPDVKSVVVSLRVRIADDARPGAILGLPLSVVAWVDRDPDPRISPSVSTVADGTYWEIEVVEPLVTVEDFETAVRDILDRIEGVAKETKATANRTEGLAEDIQAVTEAVDETTQATAAKTDALDGKTDALDRKTDKLSETTAALDRKTDALDEKIEALNSTATQIRKELVDEVDPWKQLFVEGEIGWFIRWGGFGALASFVAGAVLPFTLWRAIAWLRERQRRRKNPYLAARATAPAWRSSSQWRAVAGRASEPLAAALRRVRDRVDGLRRR